LTVSFARFGIAAPSSIPTIPRTSARRCSPNTKACLFAETIANPRLNVLDIEAVAAIAHDMACRWWSTTPWPSPYLCQPFRHGADIVVHSATKFLGGHGTTMGGVVVESGKFDWDNGKFPGHDRALGRLSRRASSTRPSATSASP
jgi:O-acetylhomoserine (thiol)-lyase